MDAELLGLIESMSDVDAMKLAVAVHGELASGRADAALAALGTGGARQFLAGMQQVAALTRDPDAPREAALGDQARRFLITLVQLDTLNPVIAAQLVDAGVRLSAQDVVDWFSGKFDLAALLGIKFEYETERIETVQTDTGTVKTRRTIKLAVGTRGS